MNSSTTASIDLPAIDPPFAELIRGSRSEQFFLATFETAVLLSSTAVAGKIIRDRHIRAHDA